MEPSKEELKELGAKDVEYLAKGWRSHVYKARIKNKEAALKVTSEGTASKEAKLLKEANKVGVGPKFYGATWSLSSGAPPKDPRTRFRKTCSNREWERWPHRE